MIAFRRDGAYALFSCALVLLAEIFIAHRVNNGYERRPHDPDSDPAIVTVVLLVILFDSVGIDETHPTRIAIVAPVVYLLYCSSKPDRTRAFPRFESCST